MDTKKAVQIAIGLGVLFATVWVVGKAWKKSQNFSGATGSARNVAAGGCVSPKCRCYYKEDGRTVTAGGQTMCAEHCCSGGI